MNEPPHPPPPVRRPFTLASWLGAVMVASGVLIQVLVHREARAAAGRVHTAASLAWLTLLLLHPRQGPRTPP